MFLARIVHNGETVLAARIDADRLVLLDGLPGVTHDAVATINQVGLPRLREITSERAARSDAVLLDVESVVFDLPVPHPQKIICLALNYSAHAAEGGQQAPEEPVMFFKPPSALTPHGGTVRNPARSSRLDYEVELAVIIGKRTTNIAPEDWTDVVLGYTVINDVTARDIQLVAIGRNQPWDQSKAFDTFAPCGPYLVTADEVPNPNNLELSLRVDGELRQCSSTSHMIFDIPTLLAIVSQNLTLEPGDIIATGTPAGIGMAGPGQVMVAEIEGIGRLANPVVYERESTSSVLPTG
jgi:5-oxopent-3-ene-1,2,5-tricarboxylate decarboxylase/2-hydroxyhepta-2,4-diene-1,7-dioate isomerase